jgi:hypothetical protein
LAPDAQPFTDMAMETLSLAVAFSEAFRTPPSDAFPFRVEIVTPEGTSTAGGKLARCRVQLLPRGGGTPVPIGVVDLRARRHELSSAGELASRGVPAEPYEALAKKLEAFFVQRRMPSVDAADATQKGGAAPVEDAQPSPARRRGLLRVIAVAFALGTALGVAFWLLSR